MKVAEFTKENIRSMLRVLCPVVREVVERNPKVGEALDMILASKAEEPEKVVAAFYLGRMLSNPTFFLEIVTLCKCHERG